MIYVTGDTHMKIDINKLNTNNFPQQKQLTKKDFVIVCGDFGMVWNGGKEEKYWLNWLNENNFTTQNGSAFSNQAIKIILTNAFYIGEITHGSIINHNGKHEAIIDLDTFDSVQAQLAENRRNPYR